jgi:peptide/nickel transport system ATP-binding protein
LLNVKDLRTHFGAGEKAVRAVDGVSFSINRGETFALLGESGCGKSLTALSIMRLLPPAGRIVEGSVSLDGQELLKLPENKMRSVRGGRIAMIFQEPQSALNPVMSVGRQIGEALNIHKNLYGEAERQRVCELLDSVGIPDPRRRIDEYPHQLSGGMKQRVMIAIALAGEPDLLIADEPTTALDVTIQAQVLELLRHIQKERGTALMLITHDLGVVKEMAHQVAVMYAGHLVEQAPAQQFFARPAHPYSRKLFESVPTLQKRGQQLAVIRGSVPSLRQQFPGCRFESRCEYAWETCRFLPPEWFALDDDAQQVRCHLYDNRYQDVQMPLHPVAAPAAKTAVSIEEKNTGKTPLLHTRDLKVHFPIRKGVFQRVVGHVRAVDGVTLDIPAGRTLALVGESGCGKTTVGKGILQLIRPTGGTVVFNGEDLQSLKGEALRTRRRDIQIIFQDPYSSMNPRMRVVEIVAEGMLAQGIGANKAEREARVVELLEQVGLGADILHRYPHEFSGGQRQRICIARALAVNPKLIVCDEPTSALDVSVQAQILNLIKELQKTLGLAYLFITHNISVVEYLAHEVAVMYLGRIVEYGTVQEVLHDPKHPYTQALLSAVPQIDPASQREVIRLSGDMPSPANPPSGCHFHPRCPRVFGACTEYPKTMALSDTHLVRCQLYHEVVEA